MLREYAVECSSLAVAAVPPGAVGVPSEGGVLSYPSTRGGGPESESELDGAQLSVLPFQVTLPSPWRAISRAVSSLDVVP